MGSFVPCGHTGDVFIRVLDHVMLMLSCVKISLQYKEEVVLMGGGED